MSNLTAIRRAALSLLARRDYSEYNLQQKLLAKGYSKEDILLMTAECIEVGYLNDHRFAEHFIRWQQNRGLGPLRISHALRRHGILASIIAEQLEIADNAWFERAKLVWAKQFKGKRPQDFKEQAKQMRFLQSRGFTSEQIEHVFTHSDEFYD